jgi:hypothetical protein
VVTADNIEIDGCPTNVFDPENSYRDAYKKIGASHHVKLWGRHRSSLPAPQNQAKRKRPC